MLKLAAAALLAGLLTQASPVYWGRPAVRMTLLTRALGFDPDGNAQWLVVTKFFDASGKPTRVMGNGNVDWTSRGAYVQWQTRLRYGQPAAIVKTRVDGPLRLLVHSTMPNLPALSVSTDTRRWRAPRVVARALGPHTVQIGWFPQERRLVRIVRIDDGAARKVLAVIAGPSSTYRDTTVQPGNSYRYMLYRADRPPVVLGPVLTPADAPATSVSNAAGKAMWLYFTTNPLDPMYYKHLDPRAIVRQAVRAGLHDVELRTAYGAYWEVTPEAKPTVDAIVDGLAAHGIGTIGWTVPRDTTFEDLRASVRTAYYRTANGTPLRGLAVDLERGDDFMGGDPQGLGALWRYMQHLREALGANYLLIATIEDPYLTHLNQSTYPYAQIARFSDVLQPMSYWRMLSRTPTTATQVRTLLEASYERLRTLARRNLPISMGGQTDAEGSNGAPAVDEITASLQTSKSLGAIGECFFSWNGTQPSQWNAITRFTW